MKNLNKITKTSLKSVTVRAKIMGAMRSAKAKRCPHYVTNRKGQKYLRVERVQDRNCGRIFCFRDSQGTDVTEMVYSALKY